MMVLVPEHFSLICQSDKEDEWTEWTVGLNAINLDLFFLVIWAQACMLETVMSALKDGS